MLSAEDGPAAGTSARIKLAGDQLNLLQIVQREVQLQHIHAGFAQEAELPPFGVRLDKGADFRVIQSPGFRDPMHLIVGGGGADVGIEAASGCRDQIDRRRRRVVGIRRMECVHTIFDGFRQRVIRWAEI